MRRPGAGCFFLVLLLCGGALAEQPKGFSAVSKDKLDGLKIILEAANCTVTAPGPEWKWLVADASEGKNFLCFNTRTLANYTVSTGWVGHDVNDHTREVFMDGIRQMGAINGAKIGNEKLEPAQTPLPGKSWRLYFEITSKQNIKTGMVLYLVQTADHAIVSLQDAAVMGADSKVFAQFVASLRLLK